jgi:glycosyltransferase involved in cell wall biosynthesis
MDPELSKRNSRDVRAELGVPPGRTLVFCAARLVPEKDIDILIRAIGRLSDRPTCLIAGEGSLKGQLQTQIDMAHLSPDVRLLGFRKDVADLMGACDIFVLPSRAEPFGLALLEAMAAGKPVIAANEGGPPEIIVSGESGLLFPAGDDAALANAIGALTNDAAKRAALGQAARKRQATVFSTERMVAEIMAVYDRALPHPSASTPARRPTALASGQP